VAALTEALKVCDAQIIAWNGKVEAERREAQRKAEEAAQAERRRLQAEADARAAKAAEDAAKLRRKPRRRPRGARRGSRTLAARAVGVDERAAARVEALQEQAATIVALSCRPTPGRPPGCPCAITGPSRS